MSNILRDYLLELESFLHSKQIRTRREHNTLILSISSNGEEIPLVIEMDEITNTTRISIPTEVEVQSEQKAKLLEKNFYLWGTKLALDPEGFLTIIAEIPTEIILEKPKEWLLNFIISNILTTYKNLKKLIESISIKTGQD